MLDRIIAAVWRILDAVLRMPPGDTAPGTEGDEGVLRARVRVRFFEKQGHGGFR